MTDTTSTSPSDEAILQAYDSVPANGNPRDVHLAGLRAVFALWFKHMEPLTDGQIEKLRRDTFSTDNPFCPCDSKTMRKAVWATERAHGIGTENGGSNA